MVRVSEERARAAAEATPLRKSPKNRAARANYGSQELRLGPSAPMRNAAGLRQTSALI
jgi:hypothetical protein